MVLFTVNEEEMINLEQISSIKYSIINDARVVLAVLSDGGAYVIPQAKHKEFFTMVMALSKQVDKQFVSL